MGQQPTTSTALPGLLSSLWFSFDSSEEEKELWILEQEVAAEMERIEQRHCETLPIGKSGNEGKESQPISMPVLLDDYVIQNPIDLQSYVDEDDEEDEEEDDNDDEESESHDDDDEEEIDMDVEDHDSPTF